MKNFKPNSTKPTTRLTAKQIREAITEIRFSPNDSGIAPIAAIGTPEFYEISAIEKIQSAVMARTSGHMDEYQRLMSKAAQFLILAKIKV